MQKENNMRIISGLIPLDTRVKFGGKEVRYEGKITAVTIRKIFVCYEVTFWKDYEQKTIGLYESELEILDETERNEVGFRI